MAKILLFITYLLSLSVFALTVEEEALILNQEMDFLETAANELEIRTETAASPVESSNPATERSLEDTYFGSESDEVNVRRAAPKRRSF